MLVLKGYAMGVMLILRGIADVSHPQGLLDDKSALATAEKLGYAGEILDMSGRAYAGSPQVRAALARIRRGGDVEAIYGFSAGGYNTRHIWEELSDDEKAKIRTVIVLGSPGVEEDDFDGCDDVTVKIDPPQGHMAGPRVFLQELE